MLLGILQCMVTIGRPDLCQLVASLNHFGAYLREGHVYLSVRAFGHLRITLNKQITIDSRPMKINKSSPKFEKLIPIFLKDYPDTKRR